ncbi:MAG: GntR family transcriptional regulator [Azospirillum brasilense]|nr:MAG: GntR family transcriptional regulator [Azospirillum brasilense]
MRRRTAEATQEPDPIAAPEPASRAALAYRALRRAIIEQALRPGSKLPEDAIGEQLGVSRTLVREALSRLSAEGLVELRHNRGATVAYPSLEEARDVFAIRQAMERLVAEQLAPRVTPEQIVRLEAHVEAEERAAGRDGPESIRLAGEFHLLLAEMTGNALLVRYVNELASRCSLILAIYGRPHSTDCAVSEHRELIAAFRKGDVPACRRLMEHHLESVMGRALLAQPPERGLRDVLAGYAGAEGLTPQQRRRNRS